MVIEMSDPTRTDRAGGAAVSVAVPALADPHRRELFAGRCWLVDASGRRR
jgi:hypothetical protein